MGTCVLHRNVIFEIIDAASYTLKMAAVNLKKRIGHILFMAEDSFESTKTDTISSEEAAQNAGKYLDKYGNAILRLAYSYLHNMSDAEDILQDTLIRYIKTTPAFENEKHEKAWLLTVAANLSKNKIDYINIRKADELSEELVAENKEDLGFIWDAVKQLPDKYREVIHLFYEEGYQAKDIAKILKRNESTVRSDLNRGRQQLKNILKEAYDFE
ncbi:RNA polymerase sigma factor [Butyrivibrio sp. MB2005]|uniref:RNA polymerase sigma factor n=1 Tax=Butyrivibrio sp. MB2005 TaxID=1280678 RepID=UPI0003FB4B18|nr:sigma-70 family RNA polymerase sigma factor [Butyrivibrio sp. MB2005]